MVSVSQIYLDTVGKDLYVTREVQSKKRQYSLKVHTCKTILDVLENMPDEFYVDFIVFIIDPGIGNCLYEVILMQLSNVAVIVLYIVFFKCIRN